MGKFIENLGIERIEFELKELNVVGQLRKFLRAR